MMSSQLPVCPQASYPSVLGSDFDDTFYLQLAHNSAQSLLGAVGYTKCSDLALHTLYTGIIPIPLVSLYETNKGGRLYLRWSKTYEVNYSSY